MTDDDIPPKVVGDDPCRCHQSHATVAPFHAGHCCFWPATQDCHPAEVAAWERRDREIHGRVELKLV